MAVPKNGVRATRRGRITLTADAAPPPLDNTARSLEYTSCFFIYASRRARTSVAWHCGARESRKGVIRERRCALNVQLTSAILKKPGLRRCSFAFAVCLPMANDDLAANATPATACSALSKHDSEAGRGARGRGVAVGVEAVVGAVPVELGNSFHAPATSTRPRVSKSPHTQPTQGAQQELGSGKAKKRSTAAWTVSRWSDNIADDSACRCASHPSTATADGPLTRGAVMEDSDAVRAASESAVPRAARDDRTRCICHTAIVATFPLTEYANPRQRAASPFESGLGNTDITTPDSPPSTPPQRDQ